MEAIRTLTAAFCEKVSNDTLIGHLFAAMAPDHPNVWRIF